jgi:hypothetical protein
MPQSEEKVALGHLENRETGHLVARRRASGQAEGADRMGGSLNATVPYQHLQAVHAWCGAHLLRDLRSISDADPEGQLWATAMATTLLDANRAAHQARERGAERLDCSAVSPCSVNNSSAGLSASAR